MKITDILTEMASVELTDVEHHVKDLFRTINVHIAFTTHFKERSIDGTYDDKHRKRGSLITHDHLIDAFNRIYNKYTDLIKYTDVDDELHGIIRDTLTDLNIPFALKHHPGSKKITLVLLTIMKKHNFKSTHPDDIVIDV
jgi:hypothetical protein